MKDRQKRAKVLKEILEPKENSENSQDNAATDPSSATTTNAAAAASATNGMRSSYDTTDNAQMIHQIPVLGANNAYYNIPPSAIGTIITQQNVSSSSTVIAINNNNKLGAPKPQPPKIPIGGKTLTKLPLPPGTNVSELVNAKTPSPPRSPRAKAARASLAGAGKKGGLLNLPMPPMVPGSEDVSGDELDLSPRQAGANGSHLTPSKKTRMFKRPVILNRRNSRSAVGPGPGGLDWGERSVDVFEVLVQIGEGTYGQVKLFSSHF